MNEETRGTLKQGEVHPMAHNAMAYIRAFIATGPDNVLMLQEAMASCAIEGNRAAEVCGETLQRLLTGQPVSDRYLLGLAWFILEMSNSGEK